MKALISPNENNRICQVQTKDFPVASPLFWDDCPNDCTTEWTYADGFFSPPQAHIPTADENKAKAVQLLSETDYAELPSVSNPNESNPYLNNKDEFITYRSKVRDIAVNPIAGNLDWPVIPQGDWIKL